MTITWTTFTIRLLVGFLLAVGIGIERQWLKTREVLKINVLVTLGSAMFVMLSIMTPGDNSPTRISAQIVSGVGFLGGGVILRDGSSVRGINTAATLWCAAAVGTLVGSGYLVQAYLATLIVVGSNLLLRPLVEAFKHQRGTKKSSFTERNAEQPSVNDNAKHLLIPAEQQVNVASPVEDLSMEIDPDTASLSSCSLICFAADELKVLESIDNYARTKEMRVVEMQSKQVVNQLDSGRSEIELQMTFQTQHSASNWQYSQEIIKLLKTEVEVSSVSWKIL